MDLCTKKLGMQIELHRNNVYQGVELLLLVPMLFLLAIPKCLLIFNENFYYTSIFGSHAIIFTVLLCIRVRACCAPCGWQPAAKSIVFFCRTSAHYPLPVCSALSLPRELQQLLGQCTMYIQCLLTYVYSGSLYGGHAHAYTIYVQ